MRSVIVALLSLLLFAHEALGQNPTFQKTPTPVAFALATSSMDLRDPNSWPKFNRKVEPPSANYVITGTVSIFWAEENYPDYGLAGTYTPLPGADVALYCLDGTPVAGGSTKSAEGGKFTIKVSSRGPFVLVCSYPGIVFTSASQQDEDYLVPAALYIGSGTATPGNLGNSLTLSLPLLSNLKAHVTTEQLQGLLYSVLNEAGGKIPEDIRLALQHAANP